MRIKLLDFLRSEDLALIPKSSDVSSSSDLMTTRGITRGPGFYYIIIVPVG